MCVYQVTCVWNNFKSNPNESAECEGEQLKIHESAWPECQWLLTCNHIRNSQHSNLNTQSFARKNCLTQYFNYDIKLANMNKINE